MKKLFAFLILTVFFISCEKPVDEQPEEDVWNLEQFSGSWYNSDLDLEINIDTIAFDYVDSVYMIRFVIAEGWFWYAGGYRYLFLSDVAFNDPSDMTQGVDLYLKYSLSSLHFHFFLTLVDVKKDILTINLFRQSYEGVWIEENLGEYTFYRL